MAAQYALWSSENCDLKNSFVSLPATIVDELMNHQFNLKKGDIVVVNNKIHATCT